MKGTSKGWVGFDLDGTLAHYEGWTGGGIGEPVPAMLEMVKKYLEDGTEVRIFTARVGEYEGMSDEIRAAIAEQRKLIEDWTEKHVGKRLKVTAMKDFGMMALFDDRAFRVEVNTGRIL